MSMKIKKRTFVLEDPSALTPNLTVKLVGDEVQLEQDNDQIKIPMTDLQELVKALNKIRE